MHLGRRFGTKLGTKLGDVLVQKRRVSGRQGGGRKQPEKNENVEMDRVWVVEMISWTAAGAAAAATTAGIDRRMFFYAAFFHFFLGIQKSR